MYCRSINPTTIESAIYARWRNKASCGQIIGETRPLQLKYQRMLANKAKKSAISRWYRPMGRSSSASGPNQRSNRRGFHVLSPTYPGCRWITKGSSHDGGKQQKGMDMPSKRIKRKVHRIFFEHGGVNQRSRQEFRGMPRSTGILVA